MKISILSTFYNDRKSLKRVMDSVLMQTCTDIEHIIVDAASTDDSMDLLKEYEVKYAELNKILRWISEPDDGSWYGFNKAFEMSTGDYVMINAPDPFADKYVFTELLTILEQEKPDYVYGGMHYQKDGKIIRNWSGKPGSWKLGWMVATPTLCVKRSVLEKISELEKCGLFDPDCGVACDYKLQIRLFMDKTLKSYHMNRVMVIYYAGGGSNGGIKAKLRSIKYGQKSLVACGVKFAWFVTSCRIVRAIFAYSFASRKKIRIS